MNRRHSTLIGVLFLCLVLISTSTIASDLSRQFSNKGDTVRSHLEMAVKAAREWQSDALLWQVSAGSFIGFGGELLPCNTRVPQSGWTYYFWSPKTRMDHRVNICGKSIVPEGLGGNLHTEKEFIRGNFLDTDKIGKIVEKIQESQNCTLKGKHWEGRLKFNRIHSKPMWHANVQCSDVQYLAILIDPVTGKATSQLIEEVP